MTTPIDWLTDALRAEQRGDLDKARTMAEQALAGFESGEEPDPAGAAAALQLLGGITLRGGDPAEAVELLQQALGLREATRDVDEQASILGDLVSAHLSTGDRTEAVECARRILRLRTRQEHRDGVLSATHQLAHFLIDDGELDEATQRVDEALAMADTEDHRPRAALTLLKVRIALANRDTEGALQLGLSALQDATAARFPPVVADAKHQLARVHLARRDLEAAEGLLEEAVATRAALQDHHGHVAALRDLAAVQASRGKPRSAAKSLQAAAARVRTDPDPSLVDILMALAAIHEHGGDLAGARTAGAEAVEAALAFDRTLATGALRLQAERAVRAGDLEAASNDLRRAVEVAEQPIDRATMQAMLGQLLAAAGQMDEAIAQLNEALEAFGKIDAAAAQEVREVLEELMAGS